jgi:hypothetical protein
MVPFLYGVSLFCAGLVWLITGRPFDQITYSKILGCSYSDIIILNSKYTNNLITSLVRFLGGNTGVILGIMIIGLSLEGYRRHLILAWYILWLIPLHSMIDLVLLILCNVGSTGSLAFDISIILGFPAIQFIAQKDFVTR